MWSWNDILVGGFYKGIIFRGQYLKSWTFHLNFLKSGTTDCYNLLLRSYVQIL